MHVHFLKIDTSKSRSSCLRYASASNGSPYIRNTSLKTFSKEARNAFPSNKSSAKDTPKYSSALFWKSILPLQSPSLTQVNSLVTRSLKSLIAPLSADKNLTSCWKLSTLQKRKGNNSFSIKSIRCRNFLKVSDTQSAFGSNALSFTRLICSYRRPKYWDILRMLFAIVKSTWFQSASRKLVIRSSDGHIDRAWISASWM